MCRIVICVLISLCIALPTTTSSAVPQAQSQPLIFNQIFQQPTGQNGYEDFVLAGDMIANHPAMETLQEQGATLTAKRQAIADPDLQNALALIRVGLDKQAVAPIYPTDPDKPIPRLRLLSNMLALGRLLAAEQYILLADGETTSAIQNLRDGLRLGYAVRCEHIPISDALGMVIDSMLIGQIVKHVDQFSERDCDSLLQLIQEWQDGDHSPLPALINERDQMLRSLAKTHRDSAAMLQSLREEALSNDHPDMTQLLASASPASLEQAADEAAAICTRQFDVYIANLRVAPWQRQDWQMPDGNTLTYKLYRTVAPNFSRMIQRYDEERANLHMLGVHIAIRKYRWQYDRLPDHLEQLRLESLTTDPFNGKPLGYRRNGDDYELYSVGPFAYDDSGARIPGKHTALTLP